jgi:branched-subunit amino acid ABC-type transport system permease component
MEIIGGVFLLVWLLLFGVGCIFGLAAFAFWLWMLIDCAQHEPNEGNTKLVWILILIFTSWIGALIYYFVRRPQRLREQMPPTPRGSG